MNLRIWRGRQHYRANEEIKDGALKNHPGGDDRGLSSAQMRKTGRDIEERCLWKHHRTP